MWRLRLESSEAKVLLVTNAWALALEAGGPLRS
jgi:hypothetical protein